MNESEIGVVLDHICARLGTASEVLIPELFRYHIILNSIGFIVCLVILAISVFFFIRGWRNIFVLDKDNDMDFPIMLGAFTIGLISLLGWVISVHGLLSWLISPKAAAFIYIANLLGGS